MSVRSHRVPRARLDPIGPVEAMSLLYATLARPAVHETLVIVLDDARRGLGLVTVSGTDRADHVVGVVECLARPDLFGGEAGALVVASSRPGGGLVDGDVDRWFEMCALADEAGLELVEWYVVGRDLIRPRDLVAMPPRWIAGPPG